MEKDTQVLGISTDPKPTQTAYATSLGNLPYPLLSDFHPTAEVTKAYGLYNADRGTANRAIIIVDKQGAVRYRREYAAPAHIDMDELVSEVDAL